MKAIQLFLFTAIILVMSGFASLVSAQTKDAGEVKIKTEFHCPKGKAELETGIKKVAGVNSVEVNLDNKIVTVKFDKAKLNKDKIVAEIENLGFRTEFTPKDKDLTKKRECSHGHKE